MLKAIFSASQLQVSVDFEILELALPVLQFCSTGSSKPNRNHGANSNDLLITNYLVRIRKRRLIVKNHIHA